MGLVRGVRLCFASCVSERARTALARELGAAGLATLGPRDPQPQVPSIVVFHSSLVETIELVRSQGTLAYERVLVIALGDGHLEKTAVFQLLAAGAVDVLLQTDDEPSTDRICARLQRWAAIDELLAGSAVTQTLVGTSTAWRHVLRQVVEVARFTDAPVLITGETGTGKELVSRLIHELDPRPDKRDFVVLDCTTIVPGLSGSEFFGHEKGSFTGATSTRNGAFALADEGTLFLDEVGELPLLLQAELLRVVQEHTYKRVGGNLWQPTKFRLVCATNRDLESERNAGRFRADLYYRISGWQFHLPPLRERCEDILPLARHFLRGALERPVELDDAVAQHLLRRDYRGNIRELRQLCARLAHRHVGPGPITIGDLGSDLEPAQPGDEDWCDPSFQRAIGKAVTLGIGLKEIGKMAEDIAVRLAVQTEHGSLQLAARRLGVTDRALQLRRASSRTDPMAQSPGKKPLEP